MEIRYLRTTSWYMCRSVLHRLGVPGMRLRPGDSELARPRHCSSYVSPMIGWASPLSRLLLSPTCRLRFQPIGLVLIITQLDGAKYGGR